MIPHPKTIADEIKKLEKQECLSQEVEKLRQWHAQGNPPGPIANTYTLEWILVDYLFWLIDNPPQADYEPKTTLEERAAIRDVVANSSGPLVSRGVTAVLEDLDRAEAALGVTR